MMKFRFFLLIIIVIFIFGITIVKAEKNSFPLFGKVIYVDAGHGGKDPGALYKEIQEKKINLEISKILKEKLEKEGATVYMTRYDDVDLSNIGAYERKRSDLSNRAKLINTSNADIYISIHLNTYTYSKWSGAQMFYDDVNPSNKSFAKIVQKEFKNNRKAKEIKNLYMYRNISVPGILAEVGFLSNPNERYLLQTKKYQELICNKLILGIIKYFN